jgi:hypothetical protein
MKKLLSILMFGFLILLSACTPEETINKVTLDFPSNFSIAETIITFDDVEHAVRYRIEATNLSNQSIKRYYITKNQDINDLYFIPGNYNIKIQAIGDGDLYLDSDYSASIQYTQIDPFLVNSISEDFLADDITIRWLGRTHYNETVKTNYFYFTASGFEVKFYGTSLEAEFVTGTNPLGKEPHLVVFIDGETNPSSGTTIILDSGKKTYTIAAELAEGEHTVRVVKRSESIDSLTGLSKLTTDGYFLQADQLRNRKIEVIAASSSAGFGNLASNTNEPKSTQNSDGLRAYAYLTSHMFDAELNIFSASGWPLLKGPWTGNNNIPTAYDYVNVNSNIVWSHNNYSPDVVIINLGTNDWSYISSLSAYDKIQALENFEIAFVDFIKKINQLHPDAVIVIAYGLMNETNIYNSTLNAVQDAQDELPLVGIHSIQLPGVNSIDGIGSSYHPSVATHIKAADVLVEAISEWMNWDIVNDNIE